MLHTFPVPYIFWSFLKFSSLRMCGKSSAMESPITSEASACQSTLSSECTALCSTHEEVIIYLVPFGNALATAHNRVIIYLLRLPVNSHIWFKGLVGVYKDLAPPRHGQLVSVVPPIQIGSSRWWPCYLTKPLPPTPWNKIVCSAKTKFIKQAKIYWSTHVWFFYKPINKLM